MDRLIALVRGGAHAELEAALAELLPTYPDVAMLWKLLGVARWARQKDARQALSRAVALAPDDAEAVCNLGHALLEKGDLEQAEQACRRAIALSPAMPEAHLNLGNALQARRQLDDALESYRRAVELRPGYAEAQSNLGQTLLALGRPAEAAESCRRAVEAQPRLTAAQVNLGKAQLDLGQFEAATNSFRVALALDPKLAEAHINLGNALRSLGRYDDAFETYRQAVVLLPDDAVAHLNLGNAQFDLCRYEDAIASYRRVLELHPQSVEARVYWGNALLNLWRTEQAAEHFEAALTLRPGDFGALLGLANAYFDCQAYVSAEAHYRQALQRRPDSVAALGALAGTLRLMNRAHEAEAVCREALALDPNSAPVYEVMAELHADRGDFGEAERLHRTALSLAPGRPTSLASLAYLRRMTPLDAAWLTEAQPLADQVPIPRYEVRLRFALGKYFDDLGEYDRAFENFQRANQVAGRYRDPYDPDEFKARIDRLIEHYDADWFARPRPRAERSARPVLMVGLPRSGTTLTEQTVASHPSVFAAGELPNWPLAGRGHPPESMAGSDVDELLGDLAAAYLRTLAEHSSDAPRVLDKAHANYLNLGLINAALPNARVIHVVRDPLDTCLSLYTHDYAFGYEYAHDLKNLAVHFRNYRRLMRHWRAHLPPGVLFEVRYEDLVADHEGQTRRILDFLGLPWDERCLRFYQRPASLHNFSRWQVRQKLNSGSVGRWRRYQRHLGPLLELLDEPA
jgi:tetratricopeptide (TPR) repeat protein